MRRKETKPKPSQPNMTKKKLDMVIKIIMDEINKKVIKIK